jgi:RNA recognition motif. (a.k.a. RRM, RBD, or RNP domain)
LQLTGQQRCNEIKYPAIASKIHVTMSRMRHYSAAPRVPDDQEESSDDDDAFSALARQRPRTKRQRPSMLEEEERSMKAGDDMIHPQESAMDDQKRPVAQTSSTKRHHGAVSDARQAKMEAILMELEAETTTRAGGSGKPHRRTHLPPPRTGGSFVDPGDEHCTTNIFVGNLAPSITEEQMTELFRQFGEPLVLSILLGCRCISDY